MRLARKHWLCKRLLERSCWSWLPQKTCCHSDAEKKKAQRKEAKEEAMTTGVALVVKLAMNIFSRFVLDSGSGASKSLLL